MGPSRRIQWRAPAAMTVLPHGRSGQGTLSGRVAGPGTGDPGPVPVAEAAVAEAPVAVAEAPVAVAEAAVAEAPVAVAEAAVAEAVGP